MYHSSARTHGAFVFRQRARANLRFVRRPGGRRMVELSADDREVVASAQRDGVAVLRNLLTPAELQAARRDHEQAHVDKGNGAWNSAANAGSRAGAGGDQLGLLPGLVRLYTHPRIVAIIGAIMDGASPWIHAMTTLRYTAGFDGVAPHSDGGTVFAMPWEKVATAIFLDDIDEESGALEYCPGTHWKHFRLRDGSAPSAAPPPQPRGPEVTSAYAAGEYLPVTLSAGSVVFRVPAVWHAVRPIHRLRRYCEARYYVKDRPVAEEGVRTIMEVVERRRCVRWQHCDVILLSSLVSF